MIKYFKLDNIFGQKDSCPNCGTNFVGMDIYNYFLNRYSKDDVDLLLDKDSIVKNLSEDYIDYFLKSSSDMSIIECNALYTAMMYGYKFESPKHFYQNITGIENPSIYDGISFWVCNVCNVIWRESDE